MIKKEGGEDEMTKEEQMKKEREDEEGRSRRLR